MGPPGLFFKPLSFSHPDYINVLTNALESKPRLFADDACLITSVDTLSVLGLHKNMNAELERLQVWCSVNELTTNLTKTCILIAPPKLKRNINLHSEHRISNHFPIETVSSVKHLGVYLDDELNFKEHIKLSENKVARLIGITCKLKQMFPEKNLSSTVLCSYPSDPSAWNNYLRDYLSLLP